MKHLIVFIFTSLIVLCWGLNEEIDWWISGLWESIWFLVEKRGWYEDFFGSF